MRRETGMIRSYWNDIVNRRALNRRRALALAGTGLTGAALLAACGGGSEKKTTKTTEGPTAVAEKTGEIAFSPGSGSPAQGGRFRFALATGGETFNPVTQWTEGTNLSGLYVYDRPLTSREDSRRFVLEA